MRKFNGSAIVLTRFTSYRNIHNESSRISESGTYSEEGGTESGNEQNESSSNTNECNINVSLPPGIRPKKIRVIRKHKVEVLTDAAVCILEGMTFQQVSEKFDVPKTTLRDFMVRRGLLQRGLGKKVGADGISNDTPSTSSVCNVSRVTD